ncbi:MAG TPA: hypothetical protein VG826_06160 [Pirellulales bacterium]|nr:hypothetical protein [Pirellulales bacterium]
MADLSQCLPADYDEACKRATAFIFSHGTPGEEKLFHGDSASLDGLRDGPGGDAWTAHFPRTAADTGNLLSDDATRALFELLRRLPAFVLDGITGPRRKKLIEEMSDLCSDYLELRAAGSRGSCVPDESPIAIFRDAVSRARFAVFDLVSIWTSARNNPKGLPQRLLQEPVTETQKSLMEGHDHDKLLRLAEAAQETIKETKRCIQELLRGGIVGEIIAPDGGDARHWLVGLLNIFDEITTLRTAFAVATPGLGNTTGADDLNYRTEIYKRLLEADKHLTNTAIVAASGALNVSASDSKKRRRTAAVSATPEATTPQPPFVVLGKPGERPVVLGKTKSKLTDARYNVVKALIEAGENGLNKDEIVQKSGHGDARQVLKRLADSDPDWKGVIVMAEVTGGRYRIRVS